MTDLARLPEQSSVDSPEAEPATPLERERSAPLRQRQSSRPGRLRPGASGNRKRVVQGITHTVGSSRISLIRGDGVRGVESGTRSGVVQARGPLEGLSRGSDVAASPEAHNLAPGTSATGIAPTRNDNRPPGYCDAPETPAHPSNPGQSSSDLEEWLPVTR